MRRLSCLLFLLPSAAACAAPTLLEVGRNGLVGITFPNGARVSMYPVVEGLRWGYSDCRHGRLVAGRPADLYGQGLTVAVPVRGPQAGTVEAFGRLQQDPADPRTVHFTYRFSAAVPTALNCARLTFRLPTDDYANQPLTCSGGPAVPARMPAEPLPGGHLLNATAEGVGVADGLPHGLRLQLDSPRWCVVDDSRRWTRDDEYSIQLCALVSAEGTVLLPGQPVEVSGTMRFATEAELCATEAETPQPVSLQVRQADIANPWFPRLLNDAGETLLTVDLVQTGQRDWCHPEPLGKPQPLPFPGTPLVASARLYADGSRQAYFSVLRTMSIEPGCLRLKDVLTAHGEIPSEGVIACFSLAGEFATSGSADAMYLSEPRRPMMLGDLPAPSRSAWETARGLRLQTPEGQALVELSSDVPRQWVSWPGERVVTLTERLLEPSGGAIPDGTVCERTLALRWPAKP